MLDREALAAGQPAQGIAKTWRYPVVQAKYRRPGNGGRSAGLRNVPDVSDVGCVSPAEKALLPRCAEGLAGVRGAVLARCREDLNARFAAVDLAAGGLPSGIAVEHRGAGPLGLHEQDVREALPRKPGRRAQA